MTEFEHLITTLGSLPHETEWVEFKLNNCNPQQVGQNISALSNAAALCRKPAGYLVWGFSESGSRFTGTAFRPQRERVGGQELENWLITQLEPQIEFRILDGAVADRRFVVIEVPPASHQPVAFRGTRYIRIGTYTKKLTDHPAKEKALWAIFSEVPFEEGVAKTGVSSDDVLSLIDYPRYFSLTEQPLPDNRASILERLADDRIVRATEGGRFDITNVGASLFASDICKFDRLARKALRVIVYRGSTRVDAVWEKPGKLGYAIGFEGAVSYINDQLPRNEHIGQALRREVRMYPEIAVRELLANALIHQDFNISGTGPMVEIFDDRLEVSNPGDPLIDPLRFIDQPPRSRNESLASMMRRMNICEERGSGIDKVVDAVEEYGLPAPDFRAAGDSTVAVLFGPRSFQQMAREERIRACYQHACLLHVSGKRMTNATLRKRLGIKDSSYPIASRIIADSIEQELIKPYGGASQSKKDASYEPFWA